METRLYRIYWMLIEADHPRAARMLDVLLMRPTPPAYAWAATVGAVVGLVTGVLAG